MKIKCITLVNSKGKGQTVTLEEARELYDSLAEIFGPKEYALKQEPFIPFTTPYIDPNIHMYGGRTDPEDRTVPVAGAAYVGKVRHFGDKTLKDGYITDCHSTDEVTTDLSETDSQLAEDIDQEGR